jgi:hypothetical protein
MPLKSKKARVVVAADPAHLHRAAFPPRRLLCVPRRAAATMSTACHFFLSHFFLTAALGATACVLLLVAVLPSGLPSLAALHYTLDAPDAPALVAAARLKALPTLGSENSSSDWACGASLGAASPSAVRADLALAVQGSAAEMEAWIDLHGALASSERVSLFLLSHNAPIVSSSCNNTGGVGRPVVCLHQQGTTWTTGRNMLARAIFDEEIARASPFRYWIFSDADQMAMACSVACWELGGLAASVCCIDGLLAHVSGPLEFATLGIYYSEIYPEPAYKADHYHFVDCPDAQFHAMHRDAVAILLPYFSELDETSWWCSQAILFRFAGSCLRGGGVNVKVSGAQPDTHAGYPRGRSHSAENAVIQNAFPGLIPWPLRFEASDEGDCGDVRHPGEVQFRASDPAHVRFSLNWKTTMEYAACLNYTKPRFCSAMRA